MNEYLRKARVVHVEEHGIAADSHGSIDSNPEREHIIIEGINCTNSEFIDWFLQTETGGDFCSDGKVLIDICCGPNYKTGDVISVNKSELKR